MIKATFGKKKKTFSLCITKEKQIDYCNKCATTGLQKLAGEKKI